VVGAADDVEVVFDDDDGGAGVDEPVEQCDEVVDVGGVQAGGGFVEDVHLAWFVEFGGELEALAFAAGQGGEWLAECEVAEADLDEPGEPVVGEQFECVAGAHPEHVADVDALTGVSQRFVGEPFAVAAFAGGHHGVEEREVGVDDAGAAAVGAAAVAVGGEQAGADVVGVGEPGADGVEYAGVGGGGGAA
jgi:hypothetical protein